MRRLSHEESVLLLALLGGLPGGLVALGMLWFGDHDPKVQGLLTILILGVWLGAAFAVRRRVVFPLQTLANLLGALGEGDYTLRGRRASPDDALGQVMLEANALSATLQRQRLGEIEATALLGTVIEEIDAALFAFDSHGRLKLVNRAGERLLARAGSHLLELPAAELGLADWLEDEPQRTVERVFPGGTGRWAVRRSTFRLEGLEHRLLVITDVSRALRDEERQAWRRLIRVLGHELNNSLAPIKSIVETLKTLAARRPKPEDWQQDLETGLDLIGQRARSLSRFMADYSRLARLPEPRLGPLDVGAWVRRVAQLERRVPVAVEGGPQVTLQADGAQLDQLLINLVRNGADAAAETGGGVRVRWRRLAEEVEVVVVDDGPGLVSTDNLFVPFYSTKPGGTGIGLVLSRQIAEAHRGHLTLGNREGGGGCEARLRLPLRAGRPPAG